MHNFLDVDDVQESTVFCRVSTQSQKIEFNHILTNRLFDMWPVLNGVRFMSTMCLNALLTQLIKIGLGF